MTEENELISTVTHVLQEMTDEEICRLLQKYFSAIGKDPTLIGRMEELNDNFCDSKTYVIENLSSDFNPNHAFYCVSPNETFSVLKAFITLRQLSHASFPKWRIIWSNTEIRWKFQSSKKFLQTKENLTTKKQKRSKHCKR